MTEFVPSKKADGFKEVVTPATDERAIIAPHYVWENTGPRAVYPAIGSTLGCFVDTATGNTQAILRLDHASGPTSLVQVLCVEELRALAEGMIEIADQMEAGAADLLSAALQRKPGA